MCLAIPGEIISIAGQDLARTGHVRIGDTIKEAKLAYVPEANTGDFVLLHAGYAIRVVDRAEKEELMDLFACVSDTATQP